MSKERGLQREEEEGDQKWEETDSPRIQLVWVGFSEKFETLDKLERKVEEQKF